MNNPVSELAAEKKAQELIEKFRGITLSSFLSDRLEYESAKQCAVICVQEIIDACENVWVSQQGEVPYNYTYTESYKYWQQVLTQINKS